MDLNAYNSEYGVYIFPLLCSRFTALHHAVQSNSAACVHAFTLVADMSHLPDANEGRTPLAMAAQNAWEPIVKVQCLIAIILNVLHNYMISQILLQSRSVLLTINHTDTTGRTGVSDFVSH